MEDIVNDLNNETHAESRDANDENEENATTIRPQTRDELDDELDLLRM